LVKGDGYLAEATCSHRIKQGYISMDGGNTVRVRTWDDKAFLTIKGSSDAKGMSRYEWEREISLEDAEGLFRLCGGRFIDKTRHIVPVAGCSLCFEVDVFHGDDAGLVVAEIELPSEDAAFPRPGWLGREVTGDHRYYNSRLIAHPFSSW